MEATMTKMETTSTYNGDDNQVELVRAANSNARAAANGLELPPRTPTRCRSELENAVRAPQKSACGLHNRTCRLQNSACGLQNNTCGLQKRMWVPEQLLWATNSALGSRTMLVGSRAPEHPTGSLKWKRQSHNGKDNWKRTALKMWPRTVQQRLWVSKQF